MTRVFVVRDDERRLAYRGPNRAKAEEHMRRLIAEGRHPAMDENNVRLPFHPGAEIRAVRATTGARAGFLRRLFGQW